MGRLEGKVAIVTGAAFGNGRGMAVRFAEEGSDVVIADIDDERSEETARLIRQQERRAMTLHTDVSKKADVDELVAKTVAEFGKVDIMVANAGVSGEGADLLNLTEEQWDRVLDINLKGVFLCNQAAANQMIAQGIRGRIINIASIMAEWGSGGAGAYCASKGGVKLLTKSFAIACAPHGITVNAIGPGFIYTGMTQDFLAVTEMRDYLVDRTPVGRIGEPSDIGNVAAFLASDDSSFITGTIIFPDGGITAGLHSSALAGTMEKVAAAMQEAAAKK